MIKIDLITGFLGAGKTTFIRKYAQYLMDQGMNIGILENDLGAINVDMMLLQDLEGENCELEMIAGGCDKDSYRRRFRTKLIAMGMSGYDRVLIEPSGIFDMDDFFDALHESPLDRWYEIGSVITIIDTNLDKELSPEAEYVLASEAAESGCVIMSRYEEDLSETADETLKRLEYALKNIHCKRTFEEDEIIKKNWDDLTEHDFRKIMEAGYVTTAYEKMYIEQDDIFQSLFLMDSQITLDKVRFAAKKIFSDATYGNVCRIKGFVRENDVWMEVNATKQRCTWQPVNAGQDVLIIIGEKLSEEKIKSYLNEAEKTGEE